MNEKFILLSRATFMNENISRYGINNSNINSYQFKGLFNAKRLGNTVLHKQTSLLSSNKKDT